MGSSKARVIIGMPVFNGEKYLEETLDSILNQTFTDFEFIISDNASTDRTQQICLEYAAKDNRLRYFRNDRNLGAPDNFNRVFSLSKSEYFKWASYDDVLAPEYLQKCVSILDKDPSVVLCHSRVGVIDENSNLIGNCDNRKLTKTSSWKAHERFGDLISIRNSCWTFFGVIRTDALAKTPLHGNYIAADRNLLAELGLMGRFHEIPEHLFFRRDHPETYTRKFCEHEFGIDTENYGEQLAWWSKDNWTNFPSWKNLFEFLASIRRSKLSCSEGLLCYDEIFRWFVNEGFVFLENDVENILLRRSNIGRKLIPAIKSNLGRTVIPIIKRIQH